MAAPDIPKPHDPSKEAAKPTQSLLGDMNEILVGYYTKPGPPNNPFMHFDSKGGNPREDFERIGKQLPMEFYIHERERAKKMVEAFMDFAYKNGYANSRNADSVKAVYWTAALGSIERASGMKAPSQGKGKNPTDVLVEFKTTKGRSFLGNSAKSTKQAEAGIPFANPGIGTMGSELFGSANALSSLIDKTEKEMVRDAAMKKVLPSNWSSMTGAAKKKWQKANPAVNEIITKEWGLLAISRVRDKMFDKIVNEDWETITPWLVDFVGGTYLGPKFVKVTGRGTGPYSAALEEPEKNKKTNAIKKPFLWLETGGATSIKFYDSETGKNVFNLRFKFADRAFSSSVKASGDSVGREVGYFESISENKQEPKVKGKRTPKRRKKTNG